MGLLFSDDFNRADGALGNDWTDVVGTTQILGAEACRATGTTAIAKRVRPDTDDQRLVVVLGTQTTWGSNAGIILRSRYIDESHGWVQMLLGQSSLGDTLITVTTKTATGATHTLGILYEYVDDRELTSWGLETQGPYVRVYRNGVVIAVFTQNDISSGGQVVLGFTFSTTMFVDWFGVYSVDSPTMQVSPASVRPGSEGNMLAVWGWTGDSEIGTPGSPTFEALYGTITAQTIVSVGYGYIWYDAPADQSIDVISTTDDANQATVSVGLWYPYTPVLAGYTTGAGIPIGPILSELSTIVAAVVTAPEGSLLDQILVGLGLRGGGPTTAEQLVAILLEATAAHGIVGDAVYGNYALSIALAGVAGDAYQALLSIQAMRTGNLWTLQTVLDAIAGVDSDVAGAVTTLTNAAQAVQGAGLHDLADVLAAIAALDLAGVLDAIAAVRGSGSPDLAALLTAIGAVRGSGSPDLAGVLSAISGVRGSGNPDVAAVLDAIAAVRGSGSPDLAALLTAINLRPTNPITSLQPALDAIAGVRGAGNPDLAAVLTAIGTLPTTPAPWVAAPPLVWPGAAHVTLGTPVALSTTMRVVGPMDGALVNVTTVPSGLGKYISGDAIYAYRLGWYTFESDLGHYDEYQYLGFNKGVLVPRRIVRPTAIVLGVAPGAVGTLTPWSVSG